MNHPEEHGDLALVSAHPNLLRRNGNVLTVHGMPFEDEGDCEDGDCIQHRADHV